jgi:hypothetical protein
MRNGPDDVCVCLPEIFECFRGKLLFCERQLLQVCHLHRHSNLSLDRAASYHATPWLWPTSTVDDPPFATPFRQPMLYDSLALHSSSISYPTLSLCMSRPTKLMISLKHLVRASSHLSIKHVHLFVRLSLALSLLLLPPMHRSSLSSATPTESLGTAAPTSRSSVTR